MITVNQALLDLLRDRRVFHRTFSGERWRVGDKIDLDADCRIEPYSHIHQGFVVPRALGAFSYSHSTFAITASIGRYCSIGWRLLWLGDSHPMDWVTTSPFPHGPHPLQGFRSYLSERITSPFLLHKYASAPEPVVIGNDVWIGDEVAIKGGVNIGDGAVIGARSVVTRDVPPYAIVASSPARVVRMRFPDATVERLLAAQWWRYGPDILQPLDVRDVLGFLDRLDQLTDAPQLDLEPLTAAEILAAAQESTAASG
jgi:acetyltransferase-like isoleucine patch superfamily enzyme